MNLQLKEGSKGNSCNVFKGKGVGDEGRIVRLIKLERGVNDIQMFQQGFTYSALMSKTLMMIKRLLF